MKQACHCDELIRVTDDESCIRAEFDTITLTMSVPCAKRLMLSLVDDVFEVPDGA
jgi:hypothetical protein